MQELVELMFRSERTGYFVNKKNLLIEPDMQVIARVERGEDIGRVLNCSVEDEELQEKLEKGEINKITRIATEEDFKQLEIVKRKEQEAKEKFLKMVKKYPFEMKLLETCYQLDGNKLTFFFSADGRIDFRDFVRELATEFKTRIELHQTSGREDARRYGGFGICGKTYCCCTFLKKFNQVTIQMAKDQNLLSNLSKISGPCGRLLCCLHYEEDFYLAQSEGFPNLEEMIEYKDKKMYVLKNDYYNNKINLISDADERETITLDEYKKLKNQQRKNRSKK
ncbi:MAG: Tpl protein [Candidatus Cloacimonetes bacterium]|nr:Tpl protein [Candidatus Cloacimonadota bacterium]MCF7812935.1 Tpl protein [Candidatus Cloacimonadota bacterium]MCF7867147.1 Tpl protein [Candidatus Cloacimonadota bacterium]MCF7882533.1 Tpl protein [Candidatus Cloacimonadota bacterium]